MNWIIKIATFLLIFSSCKSEIASKTQNKTTAEDFEKNNYLIEIGEFKKMTKQPNTKIIDFRKKEAYEKGHIKGALNIWRTDLEDKSYPYEGMMAKPKQIENLFSSLGISSNDTILIYDDNGLCNSTRLWWILQNYDFKNIRLLHGGVNEWIANNGFVSTATPSIKKTIFKLPEESSMKFLISREDVQEALTTNAVIVDTRNLDEFSGKRQKKGATKAGRIPNSINIDWAEAINYKGDKKIRSFDELDSIYRQLQIAKDEPIILYCHSGFRSAHTTFILTQLLKYKKVKNYDGSWIEWSYFDNLLFEKDSTTQLIN